MVPASDSDEFVLVGRLISGAASTDEPLVVCVRNALPTGGDLDRREAELELDLIRPVTGNASPARAIIVSTRGIKAESAREPSEVEFGGWGLLVSFGLALGLGSTAAVSSLVADDTSTCRALPSDDSDARPV
jgi:hypothetical protein